jgi:hypothetical protein
MLVSKTKRLAELERELAASHEQATDKRREAILAQLSEAEREALFASVERREQPGYMLTTEDKAIERRWLEAVYVVVPEAQHTALRWREWALAWCEAIRKHG